MARLADVVDSGEELESAVTSRVSDHMTAVCRLERTLVKLRATRSRRIRQGAFSASCAQCTINHAEFTGLCTYPAEQARDQPSVKNLRCRLPPQPVWKRREIPVKRRM